MRNIKKLIIMKKTFFYTVVLFFIVINIKSQECVNKEKREKIQAKKVAFITDKLDLSVEEAQKFWPVYNELQNKLEALHSEKRKLMKAIHSNIETTSDKELEEKTSRIVHINLDKAKLELEYYEKFKKIMPIKKVFILNHAEREFNHTLLRELKSRKNHPPGR